jgi:magnesium transporter
LEAERPTRKDAGPKRARRPGGRAWFHSKRHPPAGAAPGALVIAPGAEKPRIHVIEYTGPNVQERDIDDVGALAAYRDSSSVSWIDVQGLGDAAVLGKIAEIFKLHPLALADIVNVGQRPRLDAYDGFALFITRMVRIADADASEIEVEQVSLVIGPTYVITFQEHRADVLDPVRARIRHAGPICHLGADFLAYSILDTVIDRFYPVLELLGDELEQMEDEVVEEASPETLRRLHGLRRNLLRLRRAIWPQRDAVNGLIRDDNPFIGNGVHVYLRDTYDHTVQIMDIVESDRDLAGGLMEVYLSTVSNRLNEIMKVLTVMASIFIPLSFITGVYGMNFDNVPEIHWKYGYLGIWIVMLSIAGGMLYSFWRRGWVGSGPRPRH